MVVIFMLMLMIMTKNNYHDAKLAEKCDLTIVQHLLIVELCAIQGDTFLTQEFHLMCFLHMAQLPADHPALLNS